MWTIRVVGAEGRGVSAFSRFFDRRDSMGSALDWSRAGGVSVGVDCSETGVSEALADVSDFSAGVEVVSETAIWGTGLLESDLATSSGVFWGSFIEYFFCGTVVFAGEVEAFRGICLL